MAINVLVVIDGAFVFSDDPGDFCFTALVAALNAAGFNVTKANREADGTADMDNFVFSLPDLLQYDVIWMLGDGGNNDLSNGAFFPEGTKGPISSMELGAIAGFMEQGGGVFAVGDHCSLGSDMCGQIPRVRAMRAWYGHGDPGKTGALAVMPDNFLAYANRADTTRTNPSGSYPTTDSMGDPAVTPYAYFENQSDALPQIITPTTSPAHPILRNAGHDIKVFPDHMHEGAALDVVPGYNYAQPSPYGDTAKAEFRNVAGNHQMPEVIATGKTFAQASYDVGATGPIKLDPTVTGAPPVNTLAVYEGRSVGVGRIVTGSTFHHYLDINLIGTHGVTAGLDPIVGGDAEYGQGLSSVALTYADIKQVYVNITTWLARPRPAVTLILERSTFSQDEVTATPSFAQAVYVTVDGLKPSQFPNGGMGALTGWAPSVTVGDTTPLTFTPTDVASDDDLAADRLQRITFTYRADFGGGAFGFGGPTKTVPVNLSLTTPAVVAPLTDGAMAELVKSANPFMLDLADNNTTTWLSSDIKVFHVVAGSSTHGLALPANATRDQALMALRTFVPTLDSNAFGNLPSTEGGESTLSVAAVTATMPPKNVYNFAFARVRLSPAGADSDPVQIFFRSFVSQTTAALTYQLDGMGHPAGGYLQTTTATPIDLPSTQNGGTQWLSFPFFSHTRMAPPSSQSDGDNDKPIQAATGWRIFGALIDNNLDDAYLPLTPGGSPNVGLPTLLMGEHQCIVTQVVYGDAPIVNGATPWTSDKLSQRNLAISTVSNPGLSASRVALHTFEIEATLNPISLDLPPDELLLQWPRRVPKGTWVSLHIPSWNAQDVVDLADRLYARHEIRAVDAHTIELPGGGARYVPIPQSVRRQTGVLSVQLPLGIRKGQRFDVSVQQVTNRRRVVKIPPPRAEKISLERAAALVKDLPAHGRKHTHKAHAAEGVPRGVFDLGDNRVLVTDLSVIDSSSGDFALIITHPDPLVVIAAQRESRRWREPIGAFQLGIPVSVKEEMLLYHLQLLSIMTWRLEHLNRKSTWYPTMKYYVELLIAKVRALGGDPYTVPPTPTGNIPVLHQKPGDGGYHDGHDDSHHGGHDGGHHGGHDEHRGGEKGDVVIVNIFPRDHKR
jgi:hypothetical protein